MGEKSKLRIKAQRLGTIAEVTSLLTDLESAYNSIQAFDYIVNAIASDRSKNLQQFINAFIKTYVKEHANNKDMSDKSSIDRNLLKGFKYTFDKKKRELPNLLELQNIIQIDKIVLPNDKLYLSKIIIESPGFWEVIGSFNALEQIREYLKDRYAQKKANKYSSKQEAEIVSFEIEDRTNKQINERIGALKKIGYTDEKIKPLVASMLIKPLEKLGKYQDTKQIEEPVESITPFVQLRD